MVPVRVLSADVTSVDLELANCRLHRVGRSSVPAAPHKPIPTQTYSFILLFPPYHYCFTSCPALRLHALHDYTMAFDNAIRRGHPGQFGLLANFHSTD